MSGTMVVKANIAEAACRSVLDRVLTRVGSGLLINFDAREEPASGRKEKSRRRPAHALRDHPLRDRRLPVVDAFRTLRLAPPPEIKRLFERIYRVFLKPDTNRDSNPCLSRVTFSLVLAAG